jgi:hypothetical protein
LPCHKSFDPTSRIHEILGEICEGDLSNYDEQSNAGIKHGLAFVRRVTNSAVMGNCKPTPATNFGDPLFIWSVIGEVVTMSFDGETGLAQCIGEFLSKVPVCEKDGIHAARS